MRRPWLDGPVLAIAERDNAFDELERPMQAEKIGRSKFPAFLRKFPGPEDMSIEVCLNLFVRGRWPVAPALKMG